MLEKKSILNGIDLITAVFANESIFVGDIDSEHKLHDRASEIPNKANCSGNYSNDEAYSMSFCLNELKTNKLKVVYESDMPLTGSCIPDYELILSRNLVIMVSVTRAIRVMWDTNTQRHYDIFDEEYCSILLSKKINGLCNALYNKKTILSFEFSKWGKIVARKCKVLGVLHILCPNKKVLLICYKQIRKMYSSSYLRSKKINILLSTASNPNIYPSVICDDLFT